MAPMLYLGAQLKEMGINPTFLLGGRTKADILELDLFNKFGRVCITTEDGSWGEKGFVTNHSVLTERFDRIFTCGPKPMMVAVARYAKEKKATCVMRYFEAEDAKLSRSGVAQIDADDRVLSMEEKPARPKSHWCMPAFYCYTRQDSRLIPEAIEGGCGTDAPGSLVAWLCQRSPSL